MKKLLIIVVAALMSVAGAHAQFTHMGVRLGPGFGYLTDDMATKSPIMAANIGGYLNYHFKGATSAMSRSSFMQIGLNMNRRGTRFEQELTLMNSYRKGSLYLWYLSIPVSYVWETELPLLYAGGHMVSISVGPEFSLGLFGINNDRQTTLGYSHPQVNYDTRYTDVENHRAFRVDGMRRLDVGLQIALGYRYHNFTADLIFDHGFVPVRYTPDVLRQQDNEERNAYAGTNMAIVFAVGYRMPVGK